jgi:hypothetical protein
VRMVLPLLLQSLTGRELDFYLSSVELARTAVHKVRIVLPPPLVQSLTGKELIARKVAHGLGQPSSNNSSFVQHPNGMELSCTLCKRFNGFPT